MISAILGHLYCLGLFAGGCGIAAFGWACEHAPELPWHR
jgi:hypothetical protein